MAAARVKWHGQDLPVVREIVRIDGVETAVEIPELGEPELRQIVALLATLDRFERAARLAPDVLLERVARLYIKHGGTPESWRTYTASLGVPRSKTRQPESMFQPFLRWASGGDRDTTSKLAKLAASLDQWVEFGDNRPSPFTSAPGTSEFAEWLDESHGYTNVAKRRRKQRDENYSESESANIAPFDHRQIDERSTLQRSAQLDGALPRQRAMPKGMGATRARHASIPTTGTRAFETTKKPEQSRVSGPQVALADLIGKVIRGDCLEIMSLIPDKTIAGRHHIPALQSTQYYWRRTA